MKYTLDKQHESKAGKVYLAIKFAGGDADTEHPEEWLMKDVEFEVENGKLIIENDKIDSKISDLKILKQVLGNTDAKYDEVEKEHGESIAHMFDNTPNDPQCDYQFKCYLDRVKIVAYDENANRYESYVHGL